MVWDFPGGSVVRICLPMQETQEMRVQGSERSLEKEWQPTPVFLPEKFNGQRNLAGYSPKGRKESDTAE